MIIFLSQNHLKLSLYSSTMDDSAKGSLTQIWELFTVIPCRLTDFKRQLRKSVFENIQTSDEIRGLFMSRDI